MTKLNRIQQELTQIEGGRFQKLGDVYLVKKFGYHLYSARGSMIGTDKTIPGTPDTILQKEDGSFVFVQYTTTKATGLYAKLEDDLAECLDEAKTAIARDSVSGIFLVHNSRSNGLSEDEKTALIRNATNNGWSLRFFDIDGMAMDIFLYYPQIGAEFLGVEIDTGQILEIDDFVHQYGRGNPTSPLDIGFQFRDQEIMQALEHLAETNVLVITGPAGVGKSRFAVECCRQFVQLNPDYQLRCILNKGVQVYQDIRTEFSAPGYYLVLVDDVNRLVEREYLLSLLSKNPAEAHFKLVMTVRDYAASGVLNRIPQSTPIHLTLFTGDQIRSFVKNAWKIDNPHYQDRIAQIAKGNPRLAVMTAQLAVKHNTLESIEDASTLYDEYFSYLRQDGHVLENRQNLAVAGIVALFRTIDRTSERISELYEVFGQEETAFWQSIYALHEAEVVDLYENEIAKINDQILATYLLYRVFFADSLLDFSLPLRRFFLMRPRAAADALYPVLSTFRKKGVHKKVADAVGKVWSEAAVDKERFLEFLRSFWFARPSETLRYVADLMEADDPVILEPEKLQFDDRSTAFRWPILDVLAVYAGAGIDDFRVAVQLLLSYSDKRHDLVRDIASILANDYGLQFHSRLEGYQRQAIVVEEIRQIMERDRNPISVGIFLYVAKSYLKVRFYSGYLEDGDRYVLRDFTLQNAPSLRDLRKEIWTELFLLMESTKTKTQAIDFLAEYIHLRPGIYAPEIAREDADAILPSLLRWLEPTDFRDCLIAISYFDRLDELDFVYDPASRVTFQHPALSVYDALIPDRRAHMDLGYDEFQEMARDCLMELVSQYSLSDYDSFFRHCQTIYEAVADSQRNRLQNSATQLLCMLSEENPPLFLRVIDAYLALIDPFILNPYGIVRRLLEIDKARDINSLVRFLSDDCQARWLFAYYMNVPSGRLNSVHQAQLLKLYRTAPAHTLPPVFSYFAHYPTTQPDFVVDILRQLLDRDDHMGLAAALLSLLPYDTSTANEKRSVILALSQEEYLLDQIYFIVCQEVDYADHNGFFLNLLLDFDVSFSERFVAWLYSQSKATTSFHGRNKKLISVWNRENYIEVMDRILLAVRRLPDDLHRSRYDYFKVFVVPPNPEQKREAIVEERITQYLEQLIEQFPNDMDLVATVFEIAAESLPDIRKRLLARFIAKNQNVSDFRQLPLLTYSWDNIISAYEERIQFWESLLPLFNSLPFLKHRSTIEANIESMREGISRLQRQQFVEDDW